MHSLPKTIVTAALTAMLATPMQAADAPPPPVIEAPALPIVEFTSGWYLRGDVGYRLNDFDNVTALSGLNPTNNTINDAALVGVGAGYKSGWFRADVTLDYGGRGSYEGTRTVSGDLTARVESYTALFNVYFDLGTWSGLTPYVGGGIGGSFLRGRDFAWRNNTAPLNAFTRWNLGWAWMAGISSTISPSVVVDLGYRYIDLGDATTNYDTSGNQLYINSLTAHEIRLGARYLLD